MKLLFVALGFAIMLLKGSCGSESSDQDLALQPSKKIIINDPSELVLSIGAFSVGWQIESEGVEKGGYQIKFIKLSTVTVFRSIDSIVVIWVKVFPDANMAQSNYSEKFLEKGDRFILEPQEIADSSFGYVGDATFEVLFRKENVLAKNTMFGGYDGSLNEVSKWAGK